MLLIWDRLSAHKSRAVIDYIESILLPDGQQALKVKLLPAKSAFLLSPLDMGLFGAFKKYYYKFDRSTPDLKFRAAL